MKHCRRCGVELEEQGNWSPSYVKKQDYICVGCTKAYHAQYHAEHRVELNERRRERYAAHHEREIERSHHYYVAHREERGEYSRQYFGRWAKANPDKRRRNEHRRRARMANLPATLTTEQWQEILESYGHACAYCGATGVPLEQEHMIPVSRGGGYTAANIVPACGPCNSRKGTKTAEEFMA